MPYDLRSGHYRDSSRVFVPGWNQIVPPAIQMNNNVPVSGDNFGMGALLVDPVNGSVITGTNYQGMWKSTNQGVSWSKLNTGTGGSHVDTGKNNALAIDISNHNVMWTAASNGDGGPLKSTDGGVSWATNYCGSPTQNQDPYSIRCDPFLADHVIVSWHFPWSTNGVDAGVSESSDAGATWTHHQPGFAWGAGNCLFFLNNSTTWLLGSQSNGIYRTTNSGTTWTQVSTNTMAHGGGNALMKDPVTAGRWYIAADTAVLVSADNGATWSDISTGLPGSFLGTVVTDGTNIYTAPSFPIASYQDTPWYYTTLGGTSWSTYPIGAQHYGYADPFGNGIQYNGPGCGFYDPATKICYATHLLAGVWRIQG